MQPQQHPYLCKRCFQARQSKRCRKCGERKPLTREFWLPAAASADCFRNECTACRAAYDAAKYKMQRSDPLYREHKANATREWFSNNRERALERQKKYYVRPEVQERRREHDAHRRATDPEFVEKNKQRCRDWYNSNKDRIAEERRLLRAVRRSANGGRKLRTDRSTLKYATEIWQPRT
jgi:hypothetical protein